MNRMLIIILIFLMFINPIFAASTIGKFIMATIIIVSTLIIFLIMPRNNKNIVVKKSVVSFLIVCFVNILVLVVSSIVTGYYSSLPLRIIQFVTCALVFLVGANYNWNNQDFLAINKVISLFTISYILYWPLSGFSTNYYAAYYNHGNQLGNIIFITIFFYLLPINGRNGNKKNTLFIVLSIFIMFLCNNRSVILSLGVVFLTVFVISKVKNKPKFASLIFLFTIAFLIAFTYIYPNLYGTELGKQLELLSREYFNKNFFSGRENLWLVAFDAIKNSKWFGYGAGMTPEKLFAFDLSLHNLYLQMLIQAGIVGIATLFFVLVMIFKELKKSLDNIITRNTFAFFIGILVHECFEVSLTQNNLTTGLFYWLILGIGLNYSSKIDILNLLSKLFTEGKLKLSNNKEKIVIYITEKSNK